MPHSPMYCSNHIHGWPKYAKGRLRADPEFLALHFRARLVRVRGADPPLAPAVTLIRSPLRDRSYSASIARPIAPHTDFRNTGTQPVRLCGVGGETQAETRVHDHRAESRCRCVAWLQYPQLREAVSLQEKRRHAVNSKQRFGAEDRGSLTDAEDASLGSQTLFARLGLGRGAGWSRGWPCPHAS